jgi:chromosome segregation ATPase
MAQLSRRSKDNATDLISLKEATNARDEDIRKSLRELATSVNTTQVLLGPPPVLPTARRASAYGGSVLDSKVFSSPDSTAKGFSMPRSQSAHGFMDEPRCGSPSPYSVEGAASVAMLEKIIREMVTKEGQERLLTNLAELLEKSREENVEAARKVEQLADFIKDKSESHAQALIHVRSPGDGIFDSPRDASKGGFANPGSPNPMVGDDVMKLLQRIKDSVTNAGGMTSEVKGLVRDMRGEVLGTGRDLGQKLDRLLEQHLDKDLDRSIAEGQNSQTAEEVHQIVEEGITDLKAHLSQMLQQKAQQDDDTFRQLSTIRSGPNGDEILSAVQHALVEHSRAMDSQRDEKDERDGFDRQAVLDAVKEGLKDFEPNIELQQFGLERDEVLAVLKEGLEGYQNERAESVANGGIDKGEIYEVMQEALKDFQAPVPADQINQLREELLDNVRSALTEFQPSSAHVDHEAMHAAVLEAIREGLTNQPQPPPREIEISRDDLFDAVKASLDGTTIPFNSFGEQVLQQLQELVDGMRVEFKQYSAANGRDTEQVLDAVKDGLESLRAEIETYVDRAQDVTGRDEIVDSLKHGLEQLRVDVQGYCLQGPAQDGNAEMLEYIKSEFEQLHNAVADNDRSTSRGFEGAHPDHVADILHAITSGVDAIKGHTDSRSVDRSIDDPSLEELSDAMRHEFEELKGIILQAHASDKNELLETIQDSIGALHSKLNGSEVGSLYGGGASSEIVGTIQQELAELKESIHSMLSDSDSGAIVGGVKTSLDELRSQIAADQSDASANMIGALKEELERFSESLGSALVPGQNSGDHREALDAIHASIRDMKDTAATQGQGGISNEQLEAIRGEFVNLRSSLASGAFLAGSNEEVLDAVRLGLDDLRSHLEKKLDNPETAMNHQREVLDTLHDGLEGLRSDITKLEKPMDMTINYQILDTLKEGLSDLRAGVAKLLLSEVRSRPSTATGPGGMILLAESTDVAGTREVPHGAPPAGGDSIKQAGIEKVEVLLAQLQIKIEAMDHTIQDMQESQPAAAGASEASVKDDLNSISLMIKDLQDSVATSGARAAEPAPEGVARKEDTDAIETLLRNTKAQLDELAAKDPAADGINRDHVDEIQAVVKITNDAIESLTEKIESSTASKTDVAVVELLAQDLKAAIEDVKAALGTQASDAEKPETMTKADLDVLGVLIIEIKSMIAEISNPDRDNAPSKADMDRMILMLADFRESHDKLRDSYEMDVAVTAKAFDDRKREYDDTLLQIGAMKDTMDLIKAELLEKLADGEVGINTLGVAMKSIEANTSNDQVITDVKEILDRIRDEFERSHSSLETIKTDNAQIAESAFEVQTKHKEEVVSELSSKLDGLFDGLLAKYDEAQRAAEEKAKVMEDKAAEQEQLMNVTKIMADDLKLSIDTLGTTLSAFMGDLPATVEKMAEESKTVFAQAEQTHQTLQETAEHLRGENSMTHDQLAKLMAAVENVQGDLTENHPRFMVTLEEVRALITQHYAHSQKSSETTEEHVRAVKDLQEALKTGFEESRLHTEGLKSQQEELRTTLPALMPPPIEIPRSVEYDDSAVHTKLDQLMGHVEETAKRTTQIQRLDEIHEKVMATAAEVSAFVAAQNKQITIDHESKQKEAEELGLILERRLERKDQLEADITVLNEEKESLQHAVEALRAEKEALTAQKSRLNADVSSMETALNIRRDELHEMDAKAHAIERRMLEGVMNQSRMLLLAKSTTKPPSPKKKSQGRDLRIPSDGSAMSAHTVTSSVPSILKNGHNLAMKSARPTAQRNGGVANTTERRIVSLNQISHNSPPPAAPYGKPSLVTISGNGSTANVKRSHSVKTASFNRKHSWAPNSKRNVSITSSVLNKENEDGTLSEGEEDDYSEVRTENNLADNHESHHRSRHSVAGTDVTHDSMTYATGSYISEDYDDNDRETHDDDYADEDDDSRHHGDSERRTSYDTYDSRGTGSYLSQADLDRQPSTSSSAKCTVGTTTTHEQRDFGLTNSDLQPPPRFTEGGLVKYAPPSDSGLGTDLPSGSGAEEEYFVRR